MVFELCNLVAWQDMDLEKVADELGTHEQISRFLRMVLSERDYRLEVSDDFVHKGEYGTEVV